MPRRAAAVRRETQPDAVYNNRLVTQLINKVLLDGKKSLAERIVSTAFEIVAEKTEQGDALSSSRRLWTTSSPPLRLSPSAWAAPLTRCRWKSTSRRATTFAIRWIVDFSRKRAKEHTMAQRLAC